MLAMTEDSQVRAVEAALVARFGSRLPLTRIQAEVEACRAAFAEARIRMFVPVLIQREAAERLRRLPALVAA